MTAKKQRDPIANLHKHLSLWILRSSIAITPTQNLLYNRRDIMSLPFSDKVDTSIGKERPS